MATNLNVFNPLGANPAKWSNTLKQFVGKLSTNCLSVFDHFVKLALKGLSSKGIFFFVTFYLNLQMHYVESHSSHCQPLVHKYYHWNSLAGAFLLTKRQKTSSSHGQPTWYQEQHCKAADLK